MLEKFVVDDDPTIELYRKNFGKYSYSIYVSIESIVCFKKETETTEEFAEKYIKLLPKEEKDLVIVLFMIDNSNVATFLERQKTESKYGFIRNAKGYSIQEGFLFEI